ARCRTTRPGRRRGTTATARRIATARKGGPDVDAGGLDRGGTGRAARGTGGHRARPGPRPGRGARGRPPGRPAHRVPPRPRGRRRCRPARGRRRRHRPRERLAGPSDGLETRRSWTPLPPGGGTNVQDRPRPAEQRARRTSAPGGPAPPVQANENRQIPVSGLLATWDAGHDVGIGAAWIGYG